MTWALSVATGTGKDAPSEPQVDRDGAGPATRPSRDREAPIPRRIHAFVPFALLALWAVAIRGVQLRDMTDVGLISVLPWTCIAATLGLTVSFCVALRARPLELWVPLAHVVVLLVMLYGITGWLEPVARGAPVYRHAGIIDYIVRNGAVDPRIDAYFSWPGFFGLGALFSEAAGASPLAMASWAPLAFNLLFLPMLIAIFRWASDDARVLWLGVWVFYSANWVGQDYLSPQAVGYTLWLSMLATLLTWFTPRPEELAARPTIRGLLVMLPIGRAGRRLRGVTKALEVDSPPVLRAGLTVLVVVMFAAVVTGHQLTPFFAVIAVTALVLLARLETLGLPVILALLLAAWISYMTTAYLSGHFEVLSGPVSSAGDNLHQSVTARIGGSPEHEFIVQLRLASSAAIWALGFAGFLQRLRFRRVDMAMMLLGATPFILPLVQPYGGEMVLRVFLFALPAVAFFIAVLAFPSPAAGRSWKTIAAVAATCCVLVVSFMYTRYGNERLDSFTEGDAAAVSALYRIAPPGSTLIGSDNIPWRYEGYSDYDYHSITELEAWDAPRPDVDDIAHEVESYGTEHGAYVIITRSTEIHAALLLGKPGVLEGVVRKLRSSRTVCTAFWCAPAAREVYRGRDGSVFYIAPDDA